MTTPTDHMTIAEIIHDFATRQGDLTDRGAREDLAAILERRMVAEREVVARRIESRNTAHGDGDCLCLVCQSFTECAGMVRAYQIRTTETEGAS